MNMFKLAWRNILNNPLSLVLNIILFGLGIGLINFLLLFNEQIKTKFESNLAGIDLVIGAKGSPLQMILCNMYHVDNPTGNIKIKDAAPFLNPKHPLIKTAVPLSLGDSYKSYRIVGTNYSILELYKAKCAKGRLWKTDLEVNIGSIVASKTGLKIGDRFTSSHGFEDDEDLAHIHAAFKVVGILDHTGSVIDQLILTNTSSVWAVHDHGEVDEAISISTQKKENSDQESHDHQHSGHDHAHENHDSGSHNHDHHSHLQHDHDHDHDHEDANQNHSNHEYLHDNSNEGLRNHPEEEITAILIQFKSKTNFQALSMPRNINENTELMAASPAFQINNLNANIGVGTNALKYLAYLIALVSALSIFISLFKSLKERKYEMALMRVSGAKPSDLFSLVIAEGIILGVIGFIFGVFLSQMAMAFMANRMSDAYQYDFVSWHIGKRECMLFAVSILISIIASMIPAFMASSSDINKTLKDN